MSTRWILPIVIFLQLVMVTAATGQDDSLAGAERKLLALWRQNISGKEVRISVSDNVAQPGQVARGHGTLDLSLVDDRFRAHDERTRASAH